MLGKALPEGSLGIGRDTGLLEEALLSCIWS